MDPLSLLGGIGSAASSLFGGNAADDADKRNWQINLLNYYARERERSEKIAAAQKAENNQKLGTTDADGSTTRFVPGQGWVSTRGAEQQKLSNLQNAEQERVLQHDLPLVRDSLNRNEVRSREDDVEADTLRRGIKGLTRGSDDTLQSLLYNAATKGVNQAFDDSQATAVREAQRTDSSNIPAILKGLNQNRMKTLADAQMESTLRARGSADQEYNTKMGNMSNLYNLFATRASAAPNVSYRPQAIDTGQSNNAQFSKQLLQADNYATDAFGTKGGTLDYVSPSYGTANAIGGASNALGSMFRQQAQSYDDRLRKS